MRTTQLLRGVLAVIGVIGGKTRPMTGKTPRKYLSFEPLTSKCHRCHQCHHRNRVYMRANPDITTPWGAWDTVTSLLIFTDDTDDTDDRSPYLSDNPGDKRSPCCHRSGFSTDDTDDSRAVGGPCGRWRVPGAGQFGGTQGPRGGIGEGCAPGEGKGVIHEREAKAVH